jgi:hypothetical protein
MSGIELRNKYVRKINKKISQVANGIVILSQIDKKLKIKNLRGGAPDPDPDKFALIGDDSNNKTVVDFTKLRSAIDTATDYTWIERTQWDSLVAKINELKNSHAKLKDELPQTDVIANLTTQIGLLQDYINNLQKIIADKSIPNNVEVTNLIDELNKSIKSINSNNNVNSGVAP